MTSSALPLAHPRPIIVHSPLRWDFVWQRPQELFSRFARHRDVLFVEEPLFLDDLSRPTVQYSAPRDRLHRLVPRLPSGYRDHERATHHAVCAMVQALVAPRGALGGRFTGAIQWFYTPMNADVMLGAFRESAVVYECLNEGPRSQAMPEVLVTRERSLVARSDLVFTATARRAASMRRHHPQVFTFGQGLDVDHFAAAMAPETEVPDSLRRLKRPILGYVGVIDTRLDLPLLGKLAEDCSEASVVLAGPIVGVDPEALPRQTNIHYLGSPPHEQLPSLLKGFDVCLMPFMYSSATGQINQTHTLALLASGKPVVSTPIPDVVRGFAREVRIADRGRAYAEAARQAAHTPDVAWQRRGLMRAQRASWDTITATMSHLIDTVEPRTPWAP